MVKNSLTMFKENDEAGDISENQYDFDPKRDSIVYATRQLLWKIASSSLVDSPSKIVVVGKLFTAFQKLPEVVLEEYLRLQLIGPRRKFGEHEIYHWWSIELEENGLLFSGRSPDDILMEFMELPGHPFFVGTQAHPEFKSRPMKPAPLFNGLIKAANNR